jgi:hypothetical protein
LIFSKLADIVGGLKYLEEVARDPQALARFQSEAHSREGGDRDIRLLWFTKHVGSAKPCRVYFQISLAVSVYRFPDS